ncbi:MAG: hypothetical protein D6805_05295, partial [Planctomycetota bacterium]
PYTKEIDVYIRYYKRKLKKNSTSPQKTPTPQPTRLLQGLENKIATRLSKQNFLGAIQAVDGFRKNHQSKPWFASVQKKLEEYEAEIAQRFYRFFLEKLANSPNFSQLQKRLQHLLERGSPSFQKKIQPLQQKLLEAQQLAKLKNFRQEFFTYLRAWDFAPARQNLAKFQTSSASSSQIQALLSEYNAILKNTEAGYESYVRWLLRMAKKKRKLRLRLPGPKARPWRLVQCIPSADKVVLESGKQTLQKDMFSLLPLLHSLDKKKYDIQFQDYGFFLLFSGDLEGAKNILQPSYWQDEEKHQHLYTGLKLIQLSKRYLRNQHYEGARACLLRLQKRYWDLKKILRPYWKNKTLQQMFRQAAKGFYSQQGVEFLLPSAKIKLSSKKKYLDILYDFRKNKGKTIWKDWELVPEIFKDSELRPGPYKKTIYLYGQLRLPLHFQGDVQVEVLCYVPTNKKPLNLGVYLNEAERTKNRPFRKYFLGVWFTYPNRDRLRVDRKILWKGRLRRPVFRLPANGAIWFPKRADKRVVLYLNRVLPKIGWRRFRFAHRKKYLLCEMSGERIFVTEENHENDEKGTISIVVREGFVRIQSIRIRGKMDLIWLQNELQHRAQAEIREFVKKTP